MEVETENGEYTENHVLQQWRVAGVFTINPAEKKVLPFEDTLPLETPITEVSCRYNKNRVWLQTGMAIDLARDASDRDFLRIAPTPAMTAFLEAMKICGFSLYQADVEKGYFRARDFHSRSGCYQELEFRPAGFGQWEINEIEVSFVPDEGLTHIMLEVDRKLRRGKLTTLTLYHDRLNPHTLAKQIQGMLR